MDKYLDLTTRKKKIYCNAKVTVVSVFIRVLRTRNKMSNLR